MESRVDCGRKGKPRGELELLRGRGVGGDYPEREGGRGPNRQGSVSSLNRLSKC